MIDIIVPTYNRPVYLEECLASICRSAAEVTEPVGIIVVDDASVTGEAEAVSHRFGATYIRHETNTGVAQALADGYAASEAPFTAFFGDDDVMLPNWCRLHLAAIEEADVVSSAYNLVGPNLEHRATYVLHPVSMSDLRMNIVSANDGSLIRREVMVPLRPERERAMMLTLWLALAAKGVRFAKIDEPTFLYRRHAANLSGPLPLVAEPRFAELRREAIAEYA